MQISKEILQMINIIPFIGMVPFDHSCERPFYISCKMAFFQCMVKRDWDTSKPNQSVKLEGYFNIQVFLAACLL